jgi:hypothetical protein
VNLDLDTLKTVGSAVGAALSLPVVYVWKRATGSVQKEDMEKIVAAISKRHDEHVEDDVRRFTGIFNRLDEIAKATAKIEGYMQAQRDAKQ